TGQNDFGLWRLKMRALLVHQGLKDALNGETNLDVKMEGKDKKILLEKAHSGIILRQLDVFNKLILDLENIDVTIEDEDQALLLLCALPKTFAHFKETLLCGIDSLTLVEVQLALNSKELNERNEQRPSVHGEGLIVRGRQYKKDNKIEGKRFKS
ncbi:Retrovirus-related Pol polyprotein from transposon TNT 1-94, partial [Glycine soja]